MLTNSAQTATVAPNRLSGSRISGTNDSANTTIPTTSDRSEPHRLENHRVSRNCAVTATTPDTTNTAAVRADSCCGAMSAACSGNAR